MLIDNLYKVIKLENIDNTLKFSIEIDFSNKLFEGHFPKKPVVPGVVIINIIKELIEEKIKEKLILKSSDNIKFKAPIVPENAKLLIFEVKILEKNDDFLKISCNVLNNEITFMNFKGLYNFVK